SQTLWALRILGIVTPAPAESARPAKEVEPPRRSEAAETPAAAREVPVVAALAPATATPSNSEASAPVSDATQAASVAPAEVASIASADVSAPKSADGAALTPVETGPRGQDVAPRTETSEPVAAASAAEPDA